MKLQYRRISWFSLYTVLVLGLPGLALLTDLSSLSRGWLTAFSVAIAFQAFVILLVQFALVSRLAPISRAFGSDALTRLHRNMGLLALGFVLVHPLLLNSGRIWAAWNPFTGPTGMRAGALAIWIVALVVATSLARRRFRLSYEGWQIVHLCGACVLVGAALMHMLWIGAASGAPLMRGMLAVYTALFLALLLRYRLVRPIWLAQRPWTVVSNDSAGGSTRLVRVRPLGHAGFAFAPGQFAWLVTGAHPLWSGHHPLSIASSDQRPDDGAVEFAIKALGDWSSTAVPALAQGDRVFVDGPFGAFTPELANGAPLMLVAGGIGIAPIRSMLLSLRDRADRRQIVLFQAAASVSRMIFREEIDQLANEFNLKVVRVLERPDSDWTGERGYLTADIIRRHALAPLSRADWFVCGPLPMMDALARIAKDLGVPANQFHSERFQLV